MARAKTKTDKDGRKLLEVRYADSNEFDERHYIHKYYLSNDDKALLFPVDFWALQIMMVSDKEWFGSFKGGVLPDQLQDITIAYVDNGLEKRIDHELLRRGLLAIAQYHRDRDAELTPEELRAALNLNTWLRGYEKTLIARQLTLEEELKSALRSNDPFLTDYEIDLNITFYVREDDPWYGNDEHDWDSEAALMCTLEGVEAYTSRVEANDPDYYGLGDDQNHNPIFDCEHRNPVYRTEHCYLFHKLTDRCGVPFNHLIRIDCIWADMQVQHQQGVKFDVNGNRKMLHYAASKIDL